MFLSVAEALTAARNATIEALIERFPGTVEIASTEYAGGVMLSGEGFGFSSEGNPEVNQLATIALGKDVYETEPVRGTTVLIDGARGFLIESVSGQLDREEHWVMRCRRSPGSDE
jgi:hypothetical protein